MITNFKIFENKKLSEYIDNFCIIGNIIYLCINAINELKVTPLNDINRNLHLTFDCFEFDKNNNEIDKEAYGDFEFFKKEELNKLNFMTPTEFYNNYTELCTNLYERVKHDFDNFTFTEGDGGWYPRLIKNYKRVLETIPEFEHYISAEKYNL